MRDALQRGVVDLAKLQHDLGVQVALDVSVVLVAARRT